jgi:metallo-beta-lactamase family protein
MERRGLRLLPAGRGVKNCRVRMSFLGASGTVTGSQYLLEAAGRRVLVDCGLFQGYKQLRLRNWEKPVYDPATIDAVLLTHAHLDHSGWLPRLARGGFRGPVYCTAGTRELCGILLPDSAHLQEEDAAFANRHGISKHKPALPLYTAADAATALELLVPRTFGTVFEPAPGIRATLHPAGHLLGAAFVHIEASGITLTFSGDLGRADDPMMKPPASPPSSDFLVMESTYGDRLHPQNDALQDLGEGLAPAIARGGVVVIPAFAVGRTQALLLLLSRLKARRAIPDVPVFVDSPMAIDTTEIYRRFHHEHRISAEECREVCRAATMVTTAEGSKALDARRGPMIVISASGMATGGRVLHHLKAFAGEPRNLILLAGFQAAGTRGASLLNGAKMLRIHGQEISIRAQVAQLASASAHADANELLGWMRALPTPPRKTFVTHGEPGASDALRQRIERELGWEVELPEHQSSHSLDGMHA